jgi:hypothetical protein
MRLWTDTEIGRSTLFDSWSTRISFIVTGPGWEKMWPRNRCLHLRLANSIWWEFFPEIVCRCGTTRWEEGRTYYASCATALLCSWTEAKGRWGRLERGTSKDLLPLHYRLTKSGMLKYKEKDEKLGKGLKWLTTRKGRSDFQGNRSETYLKEPTAYEWDIHWLQPAWKEIDSLPSLRAGSRKKKSRKQRWLSEEGPTPYSFKKGVAERDVPERHRYVGDRRWMGSRLEDR